MNQQSKSNTHPVKRVLVVATSRKTRGGITAVLRAHEQMDYWKQYHCHWVQTHRDGPAWRKILYFILGLADFILRLPFYDTVHIHTATHVTQQRKRIFAWLTTFCGRHLIMHLHSSSPYESIVGPYHDLFSNSFSRADRVVALSETWRKTILSNYPIDSSRVSVVYNPCPVVEPSNEASRRREILFAGTLSKRKGYHDLIRAFALVAPKIPDWRLVFAGNGDTDRARSLAVSLGVADRIDFLGWVDGVAKADAFRRASVYCLPSYNEGFPMGVLDAFAYGLPVVTTLVGGLPDIAVEGENMLLFTPGDVDALANRLLTITGDVALRHRLHDASLRFASGFFAPSTISDTITSLYRSIP